MNPRLPPAAVHCRDQQARDKHERPESFFGNRKLTLFSAVLLTAGLSFWLTACQDSHSSKPEPIIVDPPIPDQWDVMFWDLGIWQD